jgi:hypothetical protein
MASNVWTSVWAFAGGTTVTVLATFLTTAPDPDKIKGLTYAHSGRLERQGAWFHSPEFYAVVVLLLYLYLNIKFF